MFLHQLVQKLEEIKVIQGENSVKKKHELFKELILQTDGLILNFYDLNLRAKLNVNESCCKKALILAAGDFVPLDLPTFFKLQETLSLSSGKDSNLKKNHILSEIFKSSGKLKGILIDYYTKNMFKIGLSEKSGLNCLMEMFSNEKAIKTNWQKGASLYQIYLWLVSKGQYNITEFTQKIILPMLASNNQLEFNKKYYIEPKLDGIRLLLKKDKNGYSCWTRSGLLLNAERLIALLPTKDQQIYRNLKDEFIIDGELWVPDSTAGEGFKKIMPFIKSKKMVDIPKVRYHCFDVLSYKGIETLNLSYIKRRKILESLGITKVKNALVSGSLVEFILDRLKFKTIEGLIVKDPFSVYQPNKRSKSWIKLKPNYDTIDVLVTGYQKGTGKYKDLYSSFDIAVSSSQGFKHLGQVGSGFTEKDLKIINEKIIKKEKIIIQIRAEAFTGIALRFPRFINFREDKTEPNTIEDLKAIFRKRTSINTRE